MKVKPLTTEQMQKYAILWNKLGKKEFSFKQAMNILDLTEPNTLVTLHRMKSKGWLESKKDSKNTKKSIYSLISPEEAVSLI